jgi:hypothetical protein
MGGKELGLLVGIVLVWFALNRWVLPWFGVATCMSGGCAIDRCPSVRDEDYLQRDLPGGVPQQGDRPGDTSP